MNHVVACLFCKTPYMQRTFTPSTINTTPDFNLNIMKTSYAQWMCRLMVGAMVLICSSQLMAFNELNPYAYTGSQHLSDLDLVLATSNEETPQVPQRSILENAVGEASSFGLRTNAPSASILEAGDVLMFDFEFGDQQYFKIKVMKAIEAGTTIAFSNVKLIDPNSVPGFGPGQGMLKLTVGENFDCGSYFMFRLSNDRWVYVPGTNHNSLGMPTQGTLAEVGQFRLGSVGEKIFIAQLPGQQVSGNFEDDDTEVIRTSGADFDLGFSKTGIGDNPEANCIGADGLQIIPGGESGSEGSLPRDSHATRDQTNPAPTDCTNNAEWDFTMFCDNCSESCTAPTLLNPVADPPCNDLKIFLVLDESGSIGTTLANEVRSAVGAFMTSLECKGATFAGAEFGSGAAYITDPSLGYITMDNTLTDNIDTYLNNDGGPTVQLGQGGAARYKVSSGTNIGTWTNYQAAFLIYDEFAAINGEADIILYFTDGAPTAVYLTNSVLPDYSCINTTGLCSTSAWSNASCAGPQSINPLIIANEWKCKGTHIFFAGVTGASSTVFNTIAGPLDFTTNGMSIKSTDWVIGVGSQLTDAFEAFADELCPLDITGDIDNVCPGQSTGQVTIDFPAELVSAWTDYDWNWDRDNGADTDAASGVTTDPLVLSSLDPGNYDITITFNLADGCSFDEVDEFEITQAVLVAATISGSDPTDATCPTPDDGSITIDITAGEEDYTVVVESGGNPISGSPFTFDDSGDPYTINGLSAGTYDVSVTDNNNCNTATSQVTLTDPLCCPDECNIDEIGGPTDNVCPGTQTVWQAAPVTEGVEECNSPTYTWTIINNTANAMITAGAGTDQITVDGGDACGTYTVQCTITCASCPDPLICDGPVVNVVDNTPPAIVCPGDIDEAADPGVCSATVSWAPPVGTDNCSGATTQQTAGPAPGSTFPVGTTQICYEVTDGCGLTAQCCFNVTVTDEEDPEIICPANINVGTDDGVCEAVVDWTPPVGTDNCPGASTQQTAGPAPGSTFPVGTTQICYEVTDAAGLTAECCFDVVVTDDEDPEITCPANINVGTDDGVCEAVVSWTPPVGTDNCPGASTVQSAGPAPGSAFPVGTTQICYEVTDAAGMTAECCFDVTVTDDEDPEITCPGDINVGTDDGVCEAVVDWTPPVGTDNCPGASTQQTAGPTPGSTFPVGTTQICYEVTDAAGMTAECCFDVTVTDDEDPEITCPGDINVGTDDGVCEAVVDWTPPVGTDNCPGASTQQTAGPAPGSTFPVGTTQICYEVTDAAGMTAECCFNVTVTDDEDPEITCPGDINVGTDDGVCEAVVSWTPPVGTDNCPGASTAQSAGPAPGSAFPVGTTQICYEVTDAAGMTAECCFDVTVTDDEDPEITCPANINVGTDDGLCSAIVNWTPPVGTDNCPGASTQQTAGPAPGSAFPVGTTQICYEVTDAAGMTAECCFDVTVTDDEDPEITCPGDINVGTDQGSCDAIVSWTPPVGTDNCPGASTQQTAGPSPGSVFPVGTTQICYEVTDAAGMTAECCFNVTVTDNEDPEITCPDNINVGTDDGLCSAVVNWTPPVGTDNCPGASTQQTAGPAPGSAFPVGTTQICYEVTDAGGRTAECCFDVTVTDDEDPEITCPDDINVGTDDDLCTAVVNWVPPVGTDNCPGPITVRTAGPAPGSAFPLGITQVCYEVTDAAGMTAECCFNVTVTDDQAPDCPPEPADADVDCLDEVPAPPVLVANDNCDGVLNTFVQETDNGGSGCNGDPLIIDRKWTFTDAAGNMCMVTQTVTVEDDTPPMWDVDACDEIGMTTVLADADCKAIMPDLRDEALLVLSDNCDDGLTVDDITQNPAPGSMLMPPADACGPPGSIAYTVNVTFDVADECGNNAAQLECLEAVKVEDLTPPSWDPTSCFQLQFAQETIVFGDEQCAATMPDLTDLVFTLLMDNCDDELTPGDITQTPAPGSILQKNNDGCGLDNGPIAYTVTVQFEVTDCNGNTATPLVCPDLIKVWDQIPPQWDPNACDNIGDITLPLDPNCEAIMPDLRPAAFANLTENCDMTLTPNDIIQNPAPFTTLGGDCGTVTVTFDVTDCNLNPAATLTCPDLITLVDPIPPTITCGPLIEEECMENVPAPDISTVTAFDNCDPNPVVTWVRDIVDDMGQCPNQKFILRSYKATDACGNKAYCTQPILVDDRTEPMLTGNGCDQFDETEISGCLSDGLAWDPNSLLDDIEGLYDDNCEGPIFVEFLNDDPTGSDCDWTIYYNYRIYDACGNDAFCQVTRSGGDMTPPMITSCPSDETVDCDNVPPPATQEVLATDNCPAPAIISYRGETSTQVTDGSCDEYNYTITRTWVAKDECGNVSTTCQQVITVVDDEAPGINCPADATVECNNCPGDGPNTLTNGGFESGAFAPWVDNVTGGPGSCFDHGGASATWAVLSVVPAAPGFGFAQIDPVEGDNMAVSNFDGAIRTHTLYVDFVVPAAPASVSWWDRIQFDFTTGGQSTLPRIYTVELVDPSNQAVLQKLYQSTSGLTGRFDSQWLNHCADISAFAGQSVRLLYTAVVPETCTGPGCLAIDDVIVGTTADPAPAALNGMATAQDNCDPSPVITYTDETAAGDCPEASVITRTWTAEDACGNKASCVQTITIEDSEAPVIDCPAEVTIECTETTDPANTGMAMAFDNCDLAPNVTYTDAEESGECEDEKTITRTWTAEDACGNKSSCVQIITVEDSTPPEITCAADMTVQCFDEVPPRNPFLGTASDNCDANVFITFSRAEAVGPCPTVITRYYKAVDNCGNSATCSQVIVVDDTTPPVLSCPDDMAFECMEDIPAPDAGSVDATDNCADNVDVTWVRDFVSVQGDCPNEKTVLRSYRGTDACGNTAYCTQTFTIDDNTAPMLTCPPDLTIECSMSTDPLFAHSYKLYGTAHDGPNGPSQFYEIDPSNGAATPIGAGIGFDRVGSMDRHPVTGVMYATGRRPGTSTSVLISIDVSTGVGTEVALLNGGVSHSFGSAYPDISFRNSDATLYAFLDMGDGLGTIDVNTGNLTELGGTSTSCCGNGMTFTDDDVLYHFNLNNSTTPQEAMVNILNQANGTATQVADLQLESTFDSYTRVNGADAQPGSSQIYAIVNVGIGNSEPTSQSLAVINPFSGEVTILGPTGAGLSGLAWDYSTNVSDNCVGEVTVSSDDSFSSGCGNTGVITRTWTAEDECGNEVSCVQTITIEDTTPPEISCPAPLSFECMADVTDPDPSTVTASDLCGDVVVTHVEDRVEDEECNNRKTIVRVYKATDDCDNEAICTQIISVYDETAPEISCPADLFLTCIEEVPEPDPSSVTVLEDNCGDATVTHVMTRPYEGECIPNQYTYARSYKATDDCGNKTYCTQYINVFDDIAPELSCPADVTLDCSLDRPDPNPESVVATDNCEGDVMVTWMSDDSIPGDCAGEYVIRRTYKGTDICGNMGFCTQRIVFVDTIGPMIDHIKPARVDCIDPDDIPTWEEVRDLYIYPNSSDNCSDFRITLIEKVTVTVPEDNPLFPCYTSDNYIYAGFDSCGNPGVNPNSGMNRGEISIIYRLDTLDPVIVCEPFPDMGCEPDEIPSSTDFEETGFWLIDQGYVYFDNPEGQCEFDLFLAPITDELTVEGCDTIWTIIFKGIDGCGNNSNFCAVDLVWRVDEPIVLTCPDDLTLECADETNDQQIADWMDTFLADDACSDEITTFRYDEWIPGCGETGVQVVTFIAMDTCGHVATCVRNIVIEDNTPPSLTCPEEDLVLECADESNDQQITDWLGEFTASDLCGDVTITNNYDPNGFSDDCGDTGMQVVTFYAEDECGNSASCSMTITIEDTTDPIISCPAEDLVLECGGEGNDELIAEWKASFVASDDCGTVRTTVTMLEPVEGCGNTYTQVVVFRAVDDCENSASCTRKIIVEDNTPPVPNCPGDLVLECGNEGNDAAIANWLSTFTASDNCGGTTLTNSYDENGFTDDCGETGMQVVTFTATDECGLTASCTAKIIIQDTTEPDVFCPEVDLVLECGDEENDDLIAAWLDEASARDDCGDATVSNNYDPNGFSDMCGETGMQVVTFTATDECGLTSSCTAKISIVDRTPPSITCPVPLTIECADPDNSDIVQAWLETVTASDNCGDVTTTYEFGPFDSECFMAGTYTILFTATDECGLQNTCTTVLTIEDTTKPELDCPDPELVLECGDEGNQAAIDAWTGSFRASDDCGTVETTVTFLEPSEGCGNTYTQVVVFRAVDDCGNSDSCTGTITVEDNTAPEISCPDDLVLECGFDRDRLPT